MLRANPTTLSTKTASSLQRSKWMLMGQVVGPYVNGN